MTRLSVLFLFFVSACVLDTRGSGTSTEAPKSNVSTTSGAGSSTTSGGGSEPNPVTPASGGDPSGEPDLPIDMVRTSGGVPAFASSGTPTAANDDNPQSAWSASALPAWIAYDISAAPSPHRESSLVAWTAFGSLDYMVDARTGGGIPKSYVIEGNAAPGGTAPPTTGWVTLATVTGNTNNHAEHPVLLGGANWVRMTVTESTSADSTVQIDFDVYALPDGIAADDSWMVMGDSITFTCAYHQESPVGVPQYVHQGNPDRYPQFLDAAEGGTSAETATSVIDAYLQSFPGRFVGLAYGTNGQPNAFSANMEILLQKVIAAGKTPVVPHMPWGSIAGIAEAGEQVNPQIDALLAKYPQALAGPDLWATFEGHDELFGSPAGTPDDHPNGAGCQALRQAWATMMLTVP